MNFLILLVFYFIILLCLGFLAQRFSKKTPQEYFLAGRSFGPIVLFFTMITTNFSAFTFLGFAGASYKYGLGQFGIMGFGTAIMAIMFYVIGRKVWKLGRENDYITPPELIGRHFNSNSLRLLFMSVMVIFTIPYLATQAIGAGFLIQNMTNVSWQIGAVVTMVVVMFYVLSGGMKASAWTDVIQGIIMILTLVLAVIFVAVSLGGFEAANIAAFNAKPELFTRPGGNNYFIFQMWFSFMILWLFADPMFPQIFSRFYTAKNEKSLKITMILYPLVVSFLFLCPVLIGVWAHGANVVPENSDNILPLMIEKYAQPIYSFVIIGALAALMSTADSQLLSLSTMLSHDIPFRKIHISEINIGKILVIALTVFAIFFVILGYDPNIGIMGTLVKTTFSGLAVLCPVTIAVLYWKKVTKWGCIISIVIGEISVFLFEYKVLPTLGFLSAIWAILIAIVTLILVSFLQNLLGYKNPAKQIFI